jgi:hypothetical protein
LVFVISSGVYAAEDGSQQSEDKELIVLIKTNGGLCGYGMCSAEQKVFKNGSFLRVDGSGDKKSGHAGDDILGLGDMIEKTDFKLIRGHAFQGTCPAAYDGTRIVYYFHTAHGIEEVDSCQHQIDENHPLFRKLSNLLGSLS